MNKKFTGSTTAAISMFLISGVLASVLGVRQVERITTHEVLGIAGNWPAGVSIEPTMIQKVRVDKQVTGIKDPARLLGKRLANDKKHGEIFRRNELATPPRSWLAQQVPEGKVLYTMKPQPGAIPHSQLRNGDLFDVLATGPKGVRTLARDVRLVGVMGGKNGRELPAGNLASVSGPASRLAFSMVVAIAPEYVYPLASIRSSDVVSIVLHGSGHSSSDSDSRVSIEPAPTHRNIEIVAGLIRRQVAVPMND
ncbi:hypothetical protein [Allohahella sp. A8]|uniref:hypothetical protein n=1 Tax=Allohahella sp. A8 TaxID=3141461 RepID=UPI003A80DB8F